MKRKLGGKTAFAKRVKRKGIFGPSRTNPNNLKNNCVSVSIARMWYYRTVHDLWKDVYGKHFPWPDRALTRDQMLKVLRDTGFEYHSVKYTPSGGKSAFQCFVDDPPNGGSDGDMLCAYFRRDGSGHCINYTQYGRFGAPAAVKIFNDYQHQTSNPQPQRDVENAVEINVLYYGKFIGGEEASKFFEKAAKRKRGAIRDLQGGGRSR